jgi:hypothetical protein
VMKESLSVLHELKEILKTDSRKYPGLTYRYYWNLWDRLSGNI